MIMLSLIKNKSLTQHNEVEGKWVIDEVVLISLHVEIPLNSGEYNMVEDDLEESSFVFSGTDFFYSGNHLFPKIGSWKKRAHQHLQLYTKTTKTNMSIVNNRILYTKKLDDLVSYKVFFKRI